MFTRWKWFTQYGSRKLEWLTASHMVVTGLFLLAPANSLDGSPPSIYLAEKMPEWLWGSLFLGIGLTNGYALHIDGLAAWTPYARLVATTLAMALFAYAATGFLASDPWSWGTINLLSLAFLFCGNGVLAASRDAGREYRRWRGGGHD